MKMLQPRIVTGPTTTLKVQSTTGWVGSESSSRLYGHRWRKEREAYLQANPLCKHCLEQGRTTAANEVDHIIPHRGDMKLFWDPNNRQGLCKPCHSKKTASENGGFGNA